MKKGFTLIELLAVIVILAIIALIATPIVLDVIANTKKETIKINAQNYVKAVEVALATEQLALDSKNLDGTYEIQENGKVITKNNQKIINVEYDGTGISEGKLVIENGKVIKIAEVKIDNWYVKITSNEIKLLDKLKSNTLINGETFNTTIKTLAKGETVSSYDTSDTIITTIKFLQEGILPAGYTEKEFNKLKSVDVSEKQDGTILAVYDENGTMYIYSQDTISLNTNSNSMFAYFKSLISLDVNNFDTSQVTKMSYMFKSSDSLTSLDLSNFDTRQVTSLAAMFQGCTKLEKLDLSYFDTRQVTNMSYMFQGCTKLEKLDLSNFYTNKLTTTYKMFRGCTSLTSLDLSNFDTNKLTTMGEMFYGCSALKCIKVGDKWIEENKTITDMFTNCGVSSVTKDNCPTL